MRRLIIFAHRPALAPRPQRQAGAALLILLLVMAGVAAGLMLRNTGAGPVQAARAYRTAVALKEARAALIGYAVSYPDRINPDYGPGYLPCPDRNNDGATDAGGCSLTGHTTLGRFPYKTLELEHLRDGQGETLWYVVADNFRNNPKLEPLNSDTAGNLMVDAMDDIAAIVLAPGPPLPLQDRNSGINEADNYLEDENADYDAVFSTHIGTAANDRLVFITRQELMQAVERRVLGEVYRRFAQYRDAYHAFPWLSPFANPVLSVFHAELDAGTTPKKGWQGHMAFHPFSWATRPSRMSGVNPFSSEITWGWGNVSNAVTSSNGTVDAACVVSLDCGAGPFPHITGLAGSAPVSCRWLDRATVDCDGGAMDRSVAYAYPPAAGCASGTMTRTYAVNFPPFTGMVTVHDPAPTAYRTRAVIRNGALPAATDVVRITDVYHGPLSPACDYGSVETGMGSMSFTEGTTGMLRAENIQYDLDIKAGEMPEWFFKNDWHTLVYIAYAGSETLPGASAGACSAADNCLVLNGAGSPLHRGRALALVAGRRLTGASRPAAQLSAYFEADNALFDEIFSQGPNTQAFNDQVKVIATP